MKRLFLIFVAFSLLSTPVIANNTSLNISTFPSGAEIYLNFEKDYHIHTEHISPSVINLAKENFTNLRISKIGYKDTNVVIKLIPNKENFVFIKLKPLLYESDKIEQIKFTKKQNHFKVSKKLYLLSIIPISIATGFYIKGNYEYQQAQDIQKKASKGLIQSSQIWEDLKTDYNKHKENGDKWKLGANIATTLGVACIISATIFYF